MLRQLICGILRKQGAEFSEAAGLDQSHLDGDATLLIDMDEEGQAPGLWHNCNAHNLLPRCFFLIMQTHPLYAEITSACGVEKTVSKPVVPDALYQALGITVQPAAESPAPTAPAPQPAPEKAPEPTPVPAPDQDFFGDDLSDAAPAPAQASTPTPAPAAPEPTAPAAPAPGTDSPESETRKKFMQHVLDLSFQKMRDERCPPFAAIIVKENKIIAEGWSEVVSANDPTAHAEIMAIRKAAKAQDHFRLRDCEIYCSTEPCPMCLAALYHAGISKIYYANSQTDAEEFGFEHSTITAEIGMNRKERIIPSIQLMEDEAFYALEEWKSNYSSSGYEDN